MARARAKRRSKPAFKVSLLTVAGLAPLAMTTYSGFKAGGIPKALTEMGYALTGYNAAPGYQGWNLAFTKNGLLPIVGAAVAKKLLGKLGVGRMFSKIPLIGL